MRLNKRGGIWHYDFTYRNQRVRGTTGETDKYLAGLKAHDDFEKVRNNGSTDALLRKAPTLAEFSGEFLKWVSDTHSLAENSKIAYAKGWRWLENTDLAKMKMDEIRNHHCEVIKFPGTTNAAANVALRTLRRMFHKAKELNRLYGDLPQIVERPEWPRSIEMSEEQAVLINSRWQGSDTSRDAFCLIRSTGMRPSECFAMRWEYLNWERSVYQNPKGKTNASRREVPLTFPPFDCMAILKDRYRKMHAPVEGWIFPSSTAKCGHLTTIQKPFSEARNLAGLPPQMVLYTARHGACTAVGDVSTLKESMQLMGHSDVKVAMNYQHPKSKGIAERLWDRMRTNGSSVQ